MKWGILLDFVGLTGGCLVVYGAYMASKPLGFVVAGVIFITVSALYAYKSHALTDADAAEDEATQRVDSAKP